MYKLVVLACTIAAVAAEADPVVAYAHGLGYGHGYANIAGYPYGAYGAHLGGYAAAPLGAYAAGPIAHPAPLVAAAPVAPIAAHAYALPPVRTIENAPVVETVVEPVEQWGYKIAY
jgi:hypothetical protein